MNNNFIEAEQFLKLDKKVRNAFLEWWKPQIGGLYFDDSHHEVDNIRVVNQRTEYNLDDDLEYLAEVVIPLLQMHQLINFIEEKTNFIDTVHDEIGYTITIWKEGKEYTRFCGCNCLLQTLFQIACKIAEEEVK